MGWSPKITLEELMVEMVAADADEAIKEAYLKRKVFLWLEHVNEPHYIQRPPGGLWSPWHGG